MTPSAPTSHTTALPTLLGLGPSHTIVIPATAYPTYEVGARMVGARVVLAETARDVTGESLAVELGHEAGLVGAVEQPGRVHPVEVLFQDVQPIHDKKPIGVED